MAKNNTVSKVKEQIRKFIEDREREIGEIDQHIANAEADKATAEAALKAAIETTNQNDYKTAKAAISEAESAIEMYSARRDQLVKKEFISERESNEVIDSILEYEQELAESFKAAESVLVKKLADLHEEYRAAVIDAENTLLVWQSDIHANYIARVGTMYFDEITGSYTNRSKNPIPVRVKPYFGCDEADQLREFLNTAKALYEE